MSERSSALGAARVVSPVGAHEEQPFALVLQPTVRISRRVPNVEIKNIVKIGQRSAACCRPRRIRVHDEDPRL
jgi:hypothetical protein